MDDYITNLLLLGAKVEMRSQETSASTHLAQRTKSQYQKIRRTATISKASRGQKALLYLTLK